MLRSLDGAAVRRWATTCCDVLAAHRDEIDALNVFPVPDQDTGSNLLATMRAGLDAVLQDRAQDQDVPPGSTAAVLASGALMGARGNSGVILSQVLRGLAEPLIGDDAALDAPPLDGAALREGLRRADELAAAAVSNPVHGTVLTVLHAAAHAAAALPSDELGEVASAATTAAAGALADTPRHLAVLAEAGVVDAGGRGLILLLEALLAVVTERPGALCTVSPGTHPYSKPAWEVGVPQHEYEVMYLLEGADEVRLGSLRAELNTLGDCVVVVGTGEASEGRPRGAWKVHVHCSDVGAAIEAGMRAGWPHRISVMSFADQVSGDHAAYDGCAMSHAVLVVVDGPGMAGLCRAEGAIIAPHTSNVDDILAVLVAIRAREVTVFAEPNVAQIAAAATRGAGQDVVIFPVASPVQALAALAVHDGARPAAQDRIAMGDAVDTTRCGELTVARSDTLTRAGRCQPGEFLGILGDQVVLISRDPLAAALELVRQLLSIGGELVTAVLGQDAQHGFGDALRAQLQVSHPEVEMVVYTADVPERVLLVGVE